MTGRDKLRLLGVAALVLPALIVLGLLLRSSNEDERQATQKAQGTAHHAIHETKVNARRIHRVTTFLVGPQGELGPPGLNGLHGAVGPPGRSIDGPQGPQGDTGPEGEPGANGEPGEVGAQGTQGANGESGQRGDTGPQGEVGPQGEPGAEGPPGPVGPEGPAGISPTTLTCTESSPGVFTCTPT